MHCLRIVKKYFILFAFKSYLLKVHNIVQVVIPGSCCATNLFLTAEIIVKITKYAMSYLNMCHQISGDFVHTYIALSSNCVTCLDFFIPPVYYFTGNTKKALTHK